MTALLRLERIRVRDRDRDHDRDRDRDRVLLAIDELEVEEGETLAVLGPTGAGKSTLLRVMNALQIPDEGRVLWRGEPVAVPAPLALRRRMAMVFQEPLLFRATVSDNVAYGLRLRGEPRAAVRAKVGEALRLFGIEALGERSAHTLSGGEAQRASLARALVLRPELLLLDEPLASLDAVTRERLRDELGRILRESRLSCVHVTHDQEEAEWVADRIAVVVEGRLRQVGSPEEIFCRPKDLAVASFVRTRNLLEGTVRSSDLGRICVAVGEQTVEVRSAATEVAAGERVVVCLRAEQVLLEPRIDGGTGRAGRAAAPDDPTGGDGRAGDSGAKGWAAPNRFQGRISGVRALGSFAEVTVDCGFGLVALITRRFATELGLGDGVPVAVRFEPSAAHVVVASRHEP
jgi:tungstate transport system ATP-binding protein